MESETERAIPTLVSNELLPGPAETEPDTPAVADDAGVEVPVVALCRYLQSRRVQDRVAQNRHGLAVPAVTSASVAGLCLNGQEPACQSSMTWTHRGASERVHAGRREGGRRRQLTVGKCRKRGHEQLPMLLSQAPRTGQAPSPSPWA